MKLSIALPFLLTTLPLLAQVPAAPQAAAVTSVPRLVRINSSFRPMIGSARSGAESATLAIYADETGGTPLWQETQNVVVDSEGRYSLLLGSTRNEGLPVELFTSGESRWLGVLFHRAGEVEQPRVLMATVPYALKAIDADTLGGQPASAYLLAPSATVAGSPSVVANTAAATDSSKPSKLTPKVASGTANSIAKFVNTTDLGNSVMVESNGRIGIGTSAPAAALEVATTGGGAQFTNNLANNFTFNTFSSPGNASYLYNFGNAYPSSGRFIPSSMLLDAGSILSLSAANNIRFYTNGNNERMRIDPNGNFGIGTTTPGVKLDVAGDINLSGNLYKGGNLFLHNLGTGNTALGVNALATSAGGSNTAEGFFALASNTNGTDNTATGYNALAANTSGTHNTANGDQALLSNTTGNDNTAIGTDGLAFNTTGVQNTAVGFQALLNNTTGNRNTAVGDQALVSNTTGYLNVAIGSGSALLNYSGVNNVAIGGLALTENNAGGYNIAIGDQALYEASGSFNTAIGPEAGLYITTGDYNVDIGSRGSAGDGTNSTTAGVIRIGDPLRQTSFFAAGIANAMVSGPMVLIDANTGQLGTASSSRRYKEDIVDMGQASANLLRLRPVTFRYKKPYADGSRPVDYGLIAEEVAEVYPDLVVRNKDGEIETVQYQKLTPMLLNELQKEHLHAQQQDETIQHLQEQNQKQAEKNRSLETRLAALETLLSASATPTAGQ